MTFTIHPFNRDSQNRLPAIARPHECQVYVWHHHLGLRELTELCKEGNAPTAEEGMCTKRLTERLSVLFMLHRLLGPSASMTHTKTGSPMLVGSPLHISISHTDGAYALSFSYDSHGIDIEHPSPRALRLRERFLDEEEKCISLGDGWTEEDEATAMWCAKEAAYKCFSNEHITHIGQVLLHQPKPGPYLTAAPEACNSTACPVAVTRRHNLVIALCHP